MYLVSTLQDGASFYCDAEDELNRWEDAMIENGDDPTDRDDVIHYYIFSCEQLYGAGVRYVDSIPEDSNKCFSLMDTLEEYQS